VGPASRQKGAGEQSGVAAECVDREVAAGRNLNDGSFSLQPDYVMGAACSAHVKGEKYVPVHARKAYGGSRDTAPPIH